MECGADEFELDHYLDHNYNEYELFFGLRLVLCDFCDVDFGSYDPTFFGFKNRKSLGFEHFHFIREVTDKTMHYDKYCPKCVYRLPFLKFVMESRKMNNGKDKSE